MPSKKRATPISLQPLDALFGTNEETNNGICEIKIGSLHPFPNHPFQVKDDKKMEELSESITQYGVLVPGIVRLTELIAELLDLADEKKLPFNTAVELSYLRTEEQQILFQYMSNHNMVPSMKQAKELKQISKERMLTYSEIDQICMNESTEKVQVQIPAKKLKQYFPETYTKTQMEEIIFMLLASWAEREGKE